MGTRRSDVLGPDRCGRQGDHGSAENAYDDLEHGRNAVGDPTSLRHPAGPPGIWKIGSGSQPDLGRRWFDGMDQHLLQVGEHFSELDFRPKFQTERVDQQCGVIA